MPETPNLLPSEQAGLPVIKMPGEIISSLPFHTHNGQDNSPKIDYKNLVNGEAVIISSIIWNYSQNFNNLDTAALHGQDGWVCDSMLLLVDTAASSRYEGAKGVSGVTGGGQNFNANRVMADCYKGTFYLAMMMATGGVRQTLELREGTTTALIIDNYGGNWRYSDGTWHDLEAFITDVWYVLKISFNTNTQLFSVQIKQTGGSWGTDYTNLAFYSAISNVDRINLMIDQNTTAYFDTLSLTDPT